MAKQKAKRGHVIGLRRPGWGYPCSFSASFLSYRPSIFENTYLGYSALKGTCKHFRNGLYSRAIWTRLLSSSLSLSQILLGKRKFLNLKFCPTYALCTVKMMTRKGAKELEMRSILKNFLSNVVLLQVELVQSFILFWMEIERRWEFILISTTFWRSNFFFGGEREEDFTKDNR